MKGFSHQLLPRDSPVLRSRQWSNYQLMVTRHKEDEGSSSSMFSMLDGDTPVVDAADMWRDDENIVQQVTTLTTWAVRRGLGTDSSQMGQFQDFSRGAKM